MQRHTDTTDPLSSTSDLLAQIFSETELEGLARSCGFLRRKRLITPFMLLAACVGTLGSGSAKWIADIHRTFNSWSGESVAYKPFHNQLSKPTFPTFVRAALELALKKMTKPVLETIPRHQVSMFRDIIMHDGCSMAVKDCLKDRWPGRFTKVSPAAVELHVTMSALLDQPVRITLAPDCESEHGHAPCPSQFKGCLFLEDRGYESRRRFDSIKLAGAYYVVRGKMNMRPKIVRAWCNSGEPLSALEGAILNPNILPPHDVDMEIEWGAYRGRLVALYRHNAETGDKYTFLHTNLLMSKFSGNEVGELYRLRWQIELLFKEWKSYANLRKFDTGNEPVTEGLIWASILAATLKRLIAHASEAVHKVPLSTQRVAMCSPHFFGPILRSLAVGISATRRSLEEALWYLAQNAMRSNPKRDLRTGRLRFGLRHVSA